jgi:alpha-glucosidase
MLHLYRAALHARSVVPGLGDGPLTWVPSDPGVLAFERGSGFRCITNLSSAALPLPPQAAVLLASADVSDGNLPPDATVWLRPDPEPAGPTRRVPADES